MRWQWQRLEASGEPYVVVLDREGGSQLRREEVTDLLSLGGDTPAAGLVRATPSASVPGSTAVLHEEPAATWWCETLTAQGDPVGTSGDAERVLVAALASWGLLRGEDRRDAIPVGTPDGVRDVLRGRAGLAVDLGRWRRVSSDRHGVMLCIGSETVAVMLSPRDGCVNEQVGVDGARFIVHTDPGATTVENGIARASVTVNDRYGNARRSSGLAAAAAALVLRHLGDPTTPHLWSVTMPGGATGVRMFATEEGEHVSINGPVERAAFG